MTTYGTIITRRGEALIANYLLLGKKLDITQLAVGDGGGGAYQPTPDMTELRREVWRGRVNTVEVSPQAGNVIVVRALIPQDVGGFTIREVGVFDADGNLIGVMNTPQMEKIALHDGVSTEQYIEVFLAVSSTEAINLELDPSAVMLTREELERHDLDSAAHAPVQARITEAVEEHDDSTAAHPAILQKHGDLEARLQRLEVMLVNAITGNPFVYAFDTLQGLIVEGVWNERDRRVEF